MEVEMETVSPTSEDFTPRPHKINLPNRLICRLGRSRYSGLFFGPLYGMLIYLYISFLILPGRPFTHTAQDKDFTPLMSEKTSHAVGGGVGVVTGLGLTAGSFASRRLRCTMVLIIPSLLTRRGRALLITVTIGLMVQGPVRTLRFNINQIGRGFSCMFEQLMELTSHVLSVFQEVLSQFHVILEEISMILDLYIKRLEADLSAEGIKELEEARQSVARIKAAATKAANAITFPKNFCSGVISSVSGAGSKIRKLATEFKQYVLKLVGESGNKRKRNVCDAVTILGTYTLSNITEEDLKMFLKAIGSKVNLNEIKTTDQLVKELDTSSVDYMRTEFKDLFDSALDTFLLFSIWTSKILYLTILLLVIDAHYYLASYYSDDTFDNQMVDDNLKRLRRKKLTPLRQWEIQEQYYHATDVTLTSSEVINMAIISLSSVMSALFITLVVVADYLLSSALVGLRENTALGISFPGLDQGELAVNQGESDKTFSVEAYDFTMDPCLPKGRTSPPRVLWSLYVVLFICLLSCALETYFSRLRAVICNAFYEHRAHQRATYLYDKLAQRRKVRYQELHTILRTKLRQRERAQEFSCCRRLCCNRSVKVFNKCLACDVILLTKESGLEISFEYEDSFVSESICQECSLPE